MKQNKNTYSYNWADKILKTFVNSRDFIEFEEDVDPDWTQMMSNKKTIKNDFLIMLKQKKYVLFLVLTYINDGVIKFELNNSTFIYKQRL